MYMLQPEYDVPQSQNLIPQLDSLVIQGKVGIYTFAACLDCVGHYPYGFPARLVCYHVSGHL